MAATQAKSLVYFDEQGQRQVEESFFVSLVWTNATIEAAKSVGQEVTLLAGKPCFSRTRKAFKLFPIKQLLFVSSETAPLRTLWPERLDIHDWQGLIDGMVCAKAGELLIPAISEEAFQKLTAIAKEHGLSVQLLETRTAYKKNLNPHLDEEKFIATFSQSTRSVIRRGLRSALEVQLPKDLLEAQKLLEELFVMHQSHWQAKQEDGAFGSEVVKNFHRKLVREGFEKQQVFLLALRENGAICGIVYCLLHNGWAHQYQSARTRSGAAPSLGITLHFRAMQQLRAQGIQVYDFLVGGNQLKNSLSDITEPLYWIKVQQKRTIFSIENGLRALKRGVTKRIKTLLRRP